MARWTSFDIRQHGRRVLLVLVGLVIVNVLVGLLLVRPKVEEYRRLRDEYEPRRNALRSFQRVVEAREAYTSTLDRTAGDLARLRSDVLSTKERRMVTVQLELADLARSFGVALEKVQYRNEILADEDLEYLGMVVPLEGGYTNLRRFIEAVEESEKFLVIESVSIDQAKDGGNLLQLNITLATYFGAPADIERLREERRGARRPARRGGRT